LVFFFGFLLEWGGGDREGGCWRGVGRRKKKNGDGEGRKESLRAVDGRGVSEKKRRSRLGRKQS